MMMTQLILVCSVSKVFRHGDKVPHREFQNYPNDPYREHSYYPIGNGDLTNVSTKYNDSNEIIVSCN